MTSTLHDQLQLALGDSYLLERELAAGGMSRLFLATERSLQRQAVVKLLPPELASEVSAERFRREMLVTARLQHPHILPVHAAGARDGLLYYVMPYVAGESLRARLKREGKLPLADAVRIMRDLAEALACAHEEGVVHRAVKPENVLLERGHAVLADFGVARALEQVTLGDQLTVTGLELGTPGYIAPEQLAGETNVDARADLYALGVVIYEMLAGHPPFAGATARQLALAHLTEAPRSLEHLRPETPPALAALAMRLLEKPPADRPQSAAEVLRALEVEAMVTATPSPIQPYGISASARARGLGPSSRRWLMLTGVVAAAALAAVVWVERNAVACARDPRRVAVAPFENGSGERTLDPVG